ncbi:MAG: US12 family protein [Chitinophagales bacterium]|nr:US12 family protein [Chitinophagales bacterium]
MNQYSEIVSQASQSERADFYKRTYLHVALAVLAFMVVESFLLRFIPGELIAMMFGGSYVWLFIIGLFWLGSFIANKFAFSLSRSAQYFGLGLYILLEAIIFLPMIYFALGFEGAENVVMQATVLTLSMFGGLTALVFMSGYDFSFLRTGIVIGGFVALGLIVVASFYGGLNLGAWFSLAMVVLASASILYQTSQIKDHYTTNQYVGASLQIFASIMLLFWYLLRLLSSRD